MCFTSNDKNVNEFNSMIQMINSSAHSHVANKIFIYITKNKNNIDYSIFKGLNKELIADKLVDRLVLNTNIISQKITVKLFAPPPK